MLNHAEETNPAAEERLILITRYPEPGRAKTRLIPALGAEGAASLHRRMTEYTLRIAQQLAALRSVQLEIFYDGGGELKMQVWLGDELTFCSQGDGDLGERLARASRLAFESGARRVAIIGTDCLDLTAEILDAAFNALLVRDIVIGPACDGGYYLIGMGRLLPELFDRIDWGTEKVFAQTTDRARAAGVQPMLLAELGDIDRPEDLTPQMLERLNGALS